MLFALSMLLYRGSPCASTISCDIGTLHTRILEQVAQRQRKIFVTPEVAEAHLIHRVEPACPALGKLARIQGHVVLRVVIGTQGKVEEIRALSGSPMLFSSAIDAVRQWAYKPFFLQSSPVMAQTIVTIDYKSCLWGKAVHSITLQQ